MERLREYAASLSRAFCGAPFGALAIALYAGLKSSVVVPVEVDAAGGEWQQSYLGIHDGFLFLAAYMTLLTPGARPKPPFWAFVGFAAVSLGMSFLANDVGLVSQIALDGYVNAMRLVAGFVIGYALFQSAGVPASDDYVGLIVIVLSASSLFVFDLMSDTFARFFAAGMSVASFSQFLAVASTRFFQRRRYVLLGLAFTFLLLTFSRTSLIAAVIAVALAIRRGNDSTARVFFKRHAVAAALIMALAAGITSRLDVFQLALSEFLDGERLRSMSGRAVIWLYGWELIAREPIGPFGVGYGTTPSLARASPIVADDGTVVAADHFHSIFFEMGIGMGLLGLALVAMIVWRLCRAYARRCVPALCTYTIFAITQSVDFTLYRPKELVLWGFLLGLAEAEMANDASAAYVSAQFPS